MNFGVYPQGYTDPAKVQRLLQANLSAYLAKQLKDRGLTDVYGGVEKQAIAGSAGECIPTDSGSYNVGATPM